MQNVLDHVLGTTAKVRLLRALLPLETPASGREAERLGAVSHRSATLALDDLVALGILDRTVTPATHLYRVNREHDLVPFLEALFERESKLLASLREEIAAAMASAGLADSTISVALFGSAARGEARPGSDLDLFVLSEDNARPDTASDLLEALSDRMRERYGAPAAVLALSISEARHRLEDGDPLMEDVVREDRTLFGTPVREALGVW